MKTTNLTGALLDYWTARAEGIPADQLSIRPVPRTEWVICVGCLPGKIPETLDYSTDWARGGPLIEKWSVGLDQPHWRAIAWKGGYWTDATGDTPLQAICRAVVRAAFGDEVEDLPCA